MSGKLHVRASKRSYFLTAFLVGVVLCAGALVAFWQLHVEKPANGARAASGDPGYFVGPPSLSAATVDSIFRGMGSGMVGTGSTVERISRQYNIDDAFALGVWYVETNDGMAGVGLNDRNPGSVRGSPGYPAAYDGYTIYPSFATAIGDWFNIVSTRYVNRGLSSAYTLCYPYVGTSSALQWAAKVVNLMARYKGEASPPAPPTATPRPPTPTPTAAPAKPVQSHIVQQLRPEHAQPAAQPTTRAQTKVEKSGSQPGTITIAAAPHMPLLPIVLFGLFAAVAIAISGVKVGRGIQAEPAQPEALPAPMTSPLSPAFTPLFAQEPLPVAKKVEQWQEAFDYAIVPRPAFTRPTIPARPDRSGGLLSGAGNTEALKYRLVPLPARASQEQAIDEEDTEPRAVAVSPRNMYA